ncbi:MAG: desulfoferrodoxin Dfx [Candidatus Nomurabacteria bacterium]|jgi:superoxide reductase|nr:desulfoferrodoxin Dfx [Candidatus Nomurabacteria bacterium]
MKFYKCKHCGNTFAVLYDSGVTPNCCGDAMELLAAGTSDGAKEKHVPVIERNGNAVTVRVGSEPHPMTPEHHIEWIAIVYGVNFQIVRLDPEASEARADFVVGSDEPITAYEHCNLHGLWKA